MKRKIFVNGDMTGKGIPKLAVLQYKKDKFEGYIYGDTKNEEKSFKASSVEKIEKDTDWELNGPWEVVKHPRATVYNLGEDGIPAPSVQSERYAIAVRSCGSIVRHRDGASLRFICWQDRLRDCMRNWQETSIQRAVLCRST